MKKLVLLAFSILCLLFARAQPPATIPITLNGINASDAKTMITYFQLNRAKDKSPQPTNIWFSKDEVLKIAALLNSEVDPNAKPYVTDGIRIYFIRDLTD